MNERDQLIHAQPPEELTGLRHTKPSEVAAGLEAVVVTTKKALQETGLIRGLRVLTTVNQKGGFDCSSCAWPDPDDHRSVTEFCENGAKAVVDEATTKKVGPEFFHQWSLPALSRQSDRWLNAQGRLTHPMVLRDGATRYEPIRWDDAFALIARHLNAIEPDQAAFYTSGRTSNEAAFLYQLFVRQYGTNNMPDCSNMCHESSGVALSESIGIGKGTVKLEDFYESELILVIGQNPGTNHPRMLSALERAVKNGAQVVSINPLPEAGLIRFKNPQDFMHPLRAAGTLFGQGTALASTHLPVRINGDVALLKGLMKVVLEQNAVDTEFVEHRTQGFPQLKQDLENEEWSLIVEQSGIAEAQIRELGNKIARSSRIIACWAMGLTQHKNAVATIQQVTNLLLMRGSIGKPGAGACPVRGHSNVQGDRTVGIVHNPKPAFLDALAKEFAFDPPRKHGLDTVEAIKAMEQGKVKVFLAMGGNFLSATPDTERTAAALRRTALTVHVSTKLNRSHLITGREALILPCLGRTDDDRGQYVTVENSMGVVSSSRGRLEPASDQLKSEPAIVAGLARAVLGPRSSVDWIGLAENYDRIRAKIEAVIPGFENYNQRAEKSFYLPNGPREGSFPTPSGKAVFTVHPIPRWELPPGELLMMTVRTHDQFNTVVYGLDDRYRGIYNERRVVMVNPEDMSEQGFQEGELVDLTSGGDRWVRGFLVVPYPIPRGCAATYFPETNPLVPLDSVAERSNTPVSKSVPIRLVKK